MRRGRLTGTRARWWMVVAALVALAGLARADDAADLRALIDRQRQQLEHQRQELEALKKNLTRLEEQGGQAPVATDPAPAPGATTAAPDPDAVKKVVGDYLKANPGAGVPPSVQTGFFSGQGFVIRSAPNPAWSNWSRAWPCRSSPSAPRPTTPAAGWPARRRSATPSPTPTPTPARRSTSASPPPTPATRSP